MIGTPDSSDVSYPEGVVVTGAASFFDYRVAVIDLRIGAHVTHGPYLGQTVQPTLPAGARWRDFDQWVAGLELEFSRGHFELNGDWAFSTYEVPTHANLSRRRAWFLEPKYTFTPRLFAALRLEKNDYPFIQPIDSSSWIARNVTFNDVEAGVGSRFTPDLILKASYRRDRWDISENMESFFPNGYSCGLQVSYGFDVMFRFEPRR